LSWPSSPRPRQEFACDSDIVESLKAGSFETGSSIADLATALASYYNQLLLIASISLKIASTVGQLTTTN
jgi:hypothetical protein